MFASILMVKKFNVITETVLEELNCVLDMKENNLSMLSVMHFLVGILWFKTAFSLYMISAIVMLYLDELSMKFFHTRWHVLMKSIPSSIWDLKCGPHFYWRNTIWNCRKNWSKSELRRNKFENIVIA